MPEEKIIFCGSSEQFLDNELTRHSNESNGGCAFRIPSLINANGTLIAAIDKQTSGADWGYIELAVRRSADGGKTWSDIETIATPPARETRISADCYASAFFINPCMAVAPNGDVIMLVDFYPECKGVHNIQLLDKHKIPYAQINGKMRPLIYDRDRNFYYVNEDGTVVDRKQTLTEYRVADWRGSLYRRDKYLGNIYLNGALGKNETHAQTTFGAPLKAPKRNYIFMLRSSDQGKTWSDPQDVTNMILTKTDGTFLGVAPGRGITTKDGRIIMPLSVIDNKTVSVYSVDNGETWYRMKSQPYAENKGEWQMIQAPDKTVLAFGTPNKFGKTPFSRSVNDGKNWENLGKTSLYAPKCQKSFLAKDNYVFCSHPSGKSRENGMLSVGKIIRRKGRSASVEWYKHTQINRGFFAYSCLAWVDDTTIGVLYEAQPSSYILFQTFDINEII